MMSSAFSSQLLHTLVQTAFPIVMVFSPVRVSIYPSHWSLPTGRALLRIFAYCQNVLTQHSPQPLSCPYPPSLFSDMIYKMHTKNFFFQTSYFFLNLIFYFSHHTFGEKQENIFVSCPHTISSALEDRIS